jgi:DNA repair protein RadC
MALRFRGLTNHTNRKSIYRLELPMIRLYVPDVCEAGRHIRIRTLRNPDTAHAILSAIYDELEPDQEHVVLLLYNPSHDILGFKVLASGAEDHVPIDRRIVYRNALLLGAAAIVVAHNHPAITGSGPLRPSRADLKTTRELVEAGRIMCVDLIDHIILGPKRPRNPRKFLSLHEYKPDLFK